MTVDPAVIVRLIRAEGHAVALHQPPSLIEDVDGRPIGIDPGEHTMGTLAAVVLTADEWQSVARHLLQLLDNNNPKEN